MQFIIICDVEMCVCWNIKSNLFVIPFVQLCPLYPHNPSSLLNDLRCPSEIMDFGDLSDCLSGVAGGPELHVLNPAFDYIPPELVSLFITDT